MREHPSEVSVVTHRLHRRQLLWQGVVGAGALTAGPGLLRSLVPTLGPLLPVVAVSPPTIIGREQWGADESLRRRQPDFAPISRLIVHHTVTSVDEPDPAARVRAIYAYHVQGNGWDDIGYNFVVDAAGRVYEGRATGNGRHDGEDDAGRGVVGAHAGGHNTGSVGVAILGTYTSEGITPTDAALDAVSAIAAWKFGPRTIDPVAAGTLIGHRDVTPTGCPGNGCYRRLPEVRERTRALIASAASPIPAAGDKGLVENLLDTVGGLLG
ncbi:MAG TPA: N-acetylmuramoyl-L-alanine amidase [Acidimicrobiales bacterium]|nr:N-acetylmuramoyl-L-alanine amidase [Acidimicrobiales bacterium]